MSRAFLGVWIPAYLWLRKDLTVSEKMLYLEIQSLDKDFGCIASNKKLGETIQLSPTSVSRSLKVLEEKQFITISYDDYNTFSGRKIVCTPCENDKGVCENDKAPCENDKHSNTISNINSNIKEDELKNSSAANGFIPPKNKEEKKEKGGAAKKEPNPLFVACKDYWLTEFHPGWSFGMIQGSSLKSIITKLRDLCLQTRPTCSDDEILGLFKVLCNGMGEWFKDKELQVINSKFNEIVTDLKNRKNGKQRTTGRQSIFEPIR